MRWLNHRSASRIGILLGLFMALICHGNHSYAVEQKYPAPGLWSSTYVRTHAITSADWGAVADSTCRYMYSPPRQSCVSYTSYRAISPIPPLPIQGDIIKMQCHIVGDGVTCNVGGDGWNMVTVLAYDTRQCAHDPNASYTGGQCVCHAGYVVNEAKNKCEPETYTIALVGLGGEVKAGWSRPAYAEVKTTAGEAKAGAQVSMTLSVVPDDDGQVAIAHEGKLLPSAGNTGGDGRLNFIFAAPIAGGTHTITATCTGCTNEETGTIKVQGCPIPPLSTPPFNETCATVLENLSSTQAQKEAACGALVPELITGRACFEGKLAALTPAIPLITTSSIRSLAYQAHLREVWDRMESVVEWMIDNPARQAVCIARRAEIAAEKGCDNAGRCTSCFAPTANRRSHCLSGRPANPTANFAQHAQGRAFDASEVRTVNPLQAVLAGRTPPINVQQFLNAPTNCNLNWGGLFITNYDPVHFYVP